MSDRQLHIQHDEVINRNRCQRLNTQAEAQRLADQRRAIQAQCRADRDAGDEM